MEGSIDVALVKEFYANLHDPKDKSPKQVRFRGHLIKFNAYSRFCGTRPDPQEIAA